MPCVCLDAVKTLCEKERDEPAALGSNPVRCEEDGTFSPLQCNYHQSECWCVDGLGNEVPDTRTSVYIDQHKPNCGEYPPHFQYMFVKTTGAVPAMKPEATAILAPQDGRWKITLSFDGRRFCVPKFRH